MNKLQTNNIVLNISGQSIYLIIIYCDIDKLLRDQMSLNISWILQVGSLFDYYEREAPTDSWTSPTEFH